MIDISRRSYLKYLLFGSLYFTEGVFKAVGLVIIPVYFVEKGISLPLTTFVIGIIAIPMTIKFVWGGIVDYFIRFGRKRFILLGGLLSAVGFFALTIIDPSIALIPFATFLFIGVCGVGFLDVSSDAWAIEIGREEERGKINGAMFAGQFAGVAVGSSLIALIAKLFGYSLAFLSAGSIIILIVLFPLIIKEIKIVKKRQKMGSLLVGEFKKKTTQLVAIFSPIVFINSGLLMVIIPLYMKISLQLDIAQIGLIMAIFPVTSAAGSLAGGAISDRWGRKNPLYVFIGLSIFFTAALIFANTWQIIAVVYGIIGFLQGGYFAAALAMFMDVINPKVGATQFSILTGLANLGMLNMGSGSGGILVVMLGFSRTFLYSAWIFGPALLILHFIRLKKHIRKA